jgi:hypothetical protein
MVPLTREGIRFGIRTGALQLNGKALIGQVDAQAPPGELRQLIKAAELVGRWLATAEEPSTPFALLGVAP